MSSSRLSAALSAPDVADGSAHRAICGVVRLLAEVRLAVLALAVVFALNDILLAVLVLCTAPLSYVPARSWERHGQVIARSGILLACDLVATVVVVLLAPNLLGAVYLFATVTALGVIVGWRLTLVMALPFVPLMLPLQHVDRPDEWVFGIAVVATMAAMAFTGTTLGTALRRQWLAAEESSLLRARRAATTERVRIARDIHDMVAGDLAGTILVAQVLRDRLEGEGVPADVCATADQLVELVATAHGHTRDAITELRRAELHPAEDLEELCRSWSQRSGVSCTTQIAAQVDDLEPALFADLRAMLSELLENVRRHSGAVTACVEVGVVDGAAVLRVVDDGVGLAEPAVTIGQKAAEGHYGLVGIDERSASRGGTVSRRMASRGGLDTRIWLPLRPEEAVA